MHISDLLGGRTSRPGCASAEWSASAAPHAGNPPWGSRAGFTTRNEWAEFSRRVLGRQGRVSRLKYLLKIDRLCFDGWPDRAVQIKGGQ